VVAIDGRQGQFTPHKTPYPLDLSACPKFKVFDTPKFFIGCLIEREVALPLWSDSAWLPSGEYKIRAVVISGVVSKVAREDRWPCEG
jgi:hypothetical protein